MPTAAKLISAALFMLLGYVGARVVAIHAVNKDLLPYVSPAQDFFYFPFVVGFIGIISGWRVMGPRVGRGFRASFGYGVRTSATIVFFTLILFAVRAVVLDAMRMRYSNAYEAIQAMFGRMSDFAHVLLAPDLLAVLILGGGFAGMLAEATGRRWR